jgi:hypothetical protein
MAAPEDTRYRVRLSVPRSGGWRAWGQVSGRFERLLAEQQSAAVADAHIESETRRGRDYVRVTISVAVRAPDVAHALATAWWVFRKAASDDAAGWDMAAATAEVQPEVKLCGAAEGRHARGGAELDARVPCACHAHQLLSMIRSHPRRVMTHRACSGEGWVIVRGWDTVRLSREVGPCCGDSGRGGGT